MKCLTEKIVEIAEKYHTTPFKTSILYITIQDIMQLNNHTPPESYLLKCIKKYYKRTQNDATQNM